MLTLENYYSAENKAISNSKVGDFLLSKEYYYAKHIARTLPPEEPTDAMTLGKMVDAAFSEGSVAAIGKKWKLQEKRGEKQEDGGPEPVTLAMWTKAVEMSEALLGAEFYQLYRNQNHQVYFQVPLADYLVIDKPVGQGKQKKKVAICGLPDVVVMPVNSNIVYIDDLKTSAPGAMKSPSSWYWHCVELGYFRQMAVYRLLIELAYPGRKVICRHISISSQKRGKHAIKLWELPEQALEEGVIQFKAAIYDIATEKKWKDEPIPWSSAQLAALSTGLPPMSDYEAPQA